MTSLSLSHPTLASLFDRVIQTSGDSAYSHHALERDNMPIAQPSRSNSVFDRVIQTSGNSAAGHHASGQADLAAVMAIFHRKQPEAELHRMSVRSRQQPQHDQPDRRQSTVAAADRLHGSLHRADQRLIEA